MMPTNQPQMPQMAQIPPGHLRDLRHLRPVEVA
jgi:hypothetical protein